MPECRYIPAVPVSLDTIADLPELNKTEKADAKKGYARSARDYRARIGCSLPEAWHKMKTASMRIDGAAGTGKVSTCRGSLVIF